MDMDYLTCGQCLKEFPLQKITSFIQHKKLDCDEDTGTLFQETDLKCYYCPRGFMSAWGLLVHVQLTHSLQIFVDHKTPPSLSTHANTDSWSTRIKPRVMENISLRENDKSDMYSLFSGTSKVTVEGNDESLNVEKYKKSNILKIDNCAHEAGVKTTSQKVFGCDEMFEKDGKNDSSLSESSNLALCTNNTEIAGSVDTGVSLRSITRTILMENVTTNSNTDKDKIVNVVHSYGKVKPVTLLSKLSTPVMTVGEKDSIPCGNNMSVIQHSIPQPAAAQNIMQDGPKALPASESSLKLLPMESQGLPEASGKESDTNQDQETAGRSDNIGDGEDTDMGECCDDQGCGITVIPGSHQDLQKCCNAVVPKKRKRHIEMKHMPFSWSFSRYARRRMLQRSLASASKSNSVSYVGQSTSGTSTILIDVEPDTLRHTDKNHNTDNQQGTKGETLLNDTQSNSKNLATIPMNVFPSGSESRTKSLILQPGAVFSIPFSYNVPSSVSGTAASIPISIIQAQSSHSQDDSSSVAYGKLVPIGTANKNESQQQVSRTGGQGNAGSQGEISVGEVDFRRRKYPTSKPFQCDKCPMAFNQRIHLKKHMSKHTGIKPYKCDECDYSTVERSHLKVHIRIHTGEKPFKCTYCEYATAQNSTLKIHLKRHHGGKMFACQSCDKTFTQREQLKDHESEHCFNTTGTSPPKKKIAGIDNKLAIDDEERQSAEVSQVETDRTTIDLHQKNNKDDLGHVLSIPEKN